MLKLLIGRAKSGKSDHVLRKIAELGDSSKQILLVPEHTSHQVEVDLCRVCGPTVSRHAEVLSFRRLADRVLSVTGGAAEVTLDAGGKLLTLQCALHQVSSALTVYQRPSRKAAFLQQILDLFDELRVYGVTPDTLAEKAGQITGATGEKLRDLALLYGAYETRLKNETVDARDRMTRLCEQVGESEYALGKDIFLDGFTYFNAQERRVIEVLLRQAHSVTVTLLGDKACREEIFQPTLRAIGQLERLAQQAGCPVELQYLSRRDDSALGHLERCFFGDNRAWEGDSSALRVLEADHLFSEVEQTAAQIRRLIAHGKCRWREITVSARNMEDYADVIDTVFERYGIPVYLSRRSDILEKPALTLLTGVLDAIGGGYEYDDMFRWLKTRLSGLTAEECDLLENYVLKWEIHGRMWLRDVNWTENPEGYGIPMNEGRQKQLEQINALRRRVREPLNRLAEGLKSAETVAGQVNALYEFMEEIGLQQSLQQQMDAQAAAGRLQEAEETAQLWEILCGVLDQFVELLGEEQIDLDEFIRLFRQVLTQYSVGTIPVSLDQVVVSEITRNDRHNAKYVFLLGVNDHVLPSPGQTGGILNEDDRKTLAKMDVELSPSGMDRMNMELQGLYAALAKPTEGLWVSYPVTDVAGTELRPAFVVERLRKLFPALQVEKEDSGRPYRLTAELPALEAAGRNPGGGLWNYFARREAYDRPVAAMTRAAKIRRGALSSAAVRKLYGDRIAMSASKLERMRSCHFAYFMEYGLRARPRTPAAFDAPQIGTFLHFLLENVTRDVLDMGGFARVENDKLHALVRKYIQQYVEQELDNFKDRTARFRYLFERLRATAYAIIDQVAEEMRHSDFVPLAFELSFGQGGDLPAVTISQPGGELLVGGKVDRVDGWVKDGKLYLRVVDYKSGKKTFDLSAVRMGLDIQLLLYLFALQKEGKAYFGKDIEPAGVMYLPARDEVLPARRNITAESLAQERARAMRRSGLLLSQPEVLRAMEHESLTEPQFLPLRVNKAGELSGSIASAAQLGKLGRYVEKLLHTIAAEVQQGNIDADPCCRNEDDSVCRFCDWVDACHFQDGRDGDHLRYIRPMEAAEFWKQLDENEEGGGVSWQKST